MDIDFLKPLIKKNNTKIIYILMDGIGGIPRSSDNKTELEAAYTPNLDLLASESICGLQNPVANGITPGSGPGHLGLFGYNPIKYQVGRGVLAANGINFDLKCEDVAVRGNFCTIDEKDILLDRRAGRISTEKNQQLCKLLNENINIPGIEVFIETVKEHRFLLVLRGENLCGNIHDTDPQELGVKSLPPKAKNPNSDYTVKIVSQFIDQAQVILKEHRPANMVLLRGFSQMPKWPNMQESFGLKSAAIATYPMYKGLAKLIGMNILETGQTINDEISTLEKHYDEYDFFYIHIKKTDSSGEDGDFDRKKLVIEELDTFIPKIRSLNPDIIVISGDHSTPSVLKVHSWHPVPVMIWSKHIRSDNVKEFGERACIKGALGPRFPAEDLIVIALANAKRLEKFGA